MSWCGRQVASMSGWERKLRSPQRFSVKGNCCMPHEAARAAETRDWLAKAALDLRAGEFDLTAVPPLAGDVAFHAQQLAEKALKAFLVWYDVAFRKTHNLVETVI
jgi:hypothetical protein